MRPYGGASDNTHDHRDYEGGRWCDAIPMFDRLLSFQRMFDGGRTLGSCSRHFMPDSDVMRSGLADGSWPVTQIRVDPE